MKILLWRVKKAPATIFAVGLSIAISFFPVYAQDSGALSEAAPLEQATDNSTPTADAAAVSSGADTNQEVDTPRPLSVPAWLIVILILCLLLTAISLVTTFFLYRWRKDIIKTGAMVPDEWAKFLTEIVDRSNHVATNQQEVLDGHAKLGSQIQNEVATVFRRMSDVQQTLVTFHDTLDERDREIARLKEGYDIAILEKPYSRLIEIMENTTRLSKKEGVGQKEMKNISVMIQDLLELGGVKEFTPETNVDFAELGDDIKRDVTSIETDDPHMNSKIAAVLENGLKLVSGNHAKVLKPASVQIYIHKKEAKQ